VKGEPGLASFIGAKDDESGCDNWSYRRAKLQSNHHHQQTNTQIFTGRMPFLSPNQQCQSTEGKLFMFVINYYRFVSFFAVRETVRRVMSVA